MAKDKSEVTVITDEGRFSYPNLFVPRARSKKNPDGKKQYGVTLLVPKKVKGKAVDMARYKAALHAAQAEKWGPDKAKWPKRDNPYPIQDGDSEQFRNEETGEQNPGYAGCWAIKASADEKMKPGVVDTDREPIIDQNEIYPGCKGRLVIEAYAYDKEKNGVKFTLRFAMKTGDADRIGGGGASAKEAFADLESTDFSDDATTASDDDDDDTPF